MNLDFWKKMADLWNQIDNIDELTDALQKGSELAKIWNEQDVIYQDNDFFDYDDEEDDGI